MEGAGTYKCVNPWRMVTVSSVPVRNLQKLAAPVVLFLWHRLDLEYIGMFHDRLPAL